MAENRAAQDKAARIAGAVNALLVPGWVQKIWQDEEERVIMRLRVKDATFLLILSAVPGRAGAGIVGERGQSPSRPRALLSWLRAHLEGGGLLSASACGKNLLVLSFAAKSKNVSLVLDLSDKNPAIFALDPEGTIRASTGQGKSAAGPKHGEKFPLPEIPEAPKGETGALDFLKSEGERLYSSSPMERAAAETSRKRQEKKVLRKIGNIRADLSRAGDPEALRKQADLLSGALSRVKKGMPEVEAESPEGGTVVISLDPARTPGENLEFLYKKAAKAKRAKKIAGERLAAALAELENPRPEEPARATGKPRARESSRPFLRYRSSDGYFILAGRNGPENLRLLRESRPWDIWLHARDGAGAHVVIVKPGKEAKVPERTLVEAAGIAALRSRFSSQGAVDVMYAEVSRVHRVKGGAPGKVLVSGEKTIRVPPGAGGPELLER